MDGTKKRINGNVEGARLIKGDFEVASRHAAVRKKENEAISGFGIGFEGVRIDVNVGGYWFAGRQNEVVGSL